MLHPSRIFVLYLTLFLFAVVLFLSLDLQFKTTALLTLGLFVTIFFFWRIKLLRYVLITIFVLSLALLRVELFKDRQNQINPTSLNAVITEDPEIYGRVQYLTVTSTKNTDLRFQVITNQFPSYSVGDFVLIKGKFKEIPEKKANIYKVRQISGEIAFPEIAPGEEEYHNFLQKGYLKTRKALISQRKKLEANINKLFSEPESGLLAGIVLGYRADISEELLNDLTRTGTVHIIALSGFNITILAEFLRQAFRQLSRRASIYFPLFGIWVFVLATGLSASIVRAAIMGSLLILASKFGRRSDALVAIIFAASVMVFVNPYILLHDIGFQLSFAAAFGIFFFAPRIEKYFSFLGKRLSPHLSSTISAQLFTWPITSFYFGSVSLIAPLVNLFILPFISILMIISIILISVSFLSFWLAAKISFFVWLILAYFIKVISVFSELKLASINFKISSATLVFGYYLLLCDLLLISTRRKTIVKKFI